MEALKESYLHRLHREHKERQAKWFYAPQTSKAKLALAKDPEPEPPPAPVKPSLKLMPITFDGNGSLILMLGLVVEYFGGTVVAIRGEDKHHRISRVRQIACSVLYHVKKPQISTVHLGHFMGGRDHSTIVHSLRKVAAMCARDPALKSKVTEVSCMCAQLKWPRYDGR